MNTPPPAGIEGTDLAGWLTRYWALEAVRLRYLPKGFGSYHWLAEVQYGHLYFVTVDDLGTKPWLGAEPDATFHGLEAAYGTALALYEQFRLKFVVPPVPTVDGRVIVRLSPQYGLTLFEFVDGEPGRWGEQMSGEDRHRLVDTLAQLHLSTAGARLSAPRRALEVPARASLEAALEDLSRPWDGGPFSERARRELAANAGVVREWLASFDALAARVASHAAPAVITHGEPHPGNLIRANGGFRLIDWDTAAMSQPERDLWMLDDGSGESLAAYRHATGRAIDDTAVALYRLAWRLTDIALFTALLRSDHRLNQGAEKAWNGLRDSLSCCDVPPFGS